MTALTMRSMGSAAARSAGWLLGGGLMSRSDVKRAQRACPHQNRQLMRGGRT